LLGLYALVEMVRGMEPMLSWLGLALTALGPLLFFARAFLFKSPMTSGSSAGYSMLCGLGVAMTMTMSFRYGPVAGIVHVWAGITLMGWLAYLRWFSNLQEN
ncbi:MAG: hypothetical protein WBS20_17740, partial [Lysobacterales bacterium]